MKVEFIHFPLPKRIETISGYYELIEEKIIKISGEDLLIYHGYGVVDNSCCGVGGCEFILVIGFVVEYKASSKNRGLVTSTIREIQDELKEDIKNKIKRLYPYSQIVFWKG